MNEDDQYNWIKTIQQQKEGYYLVNSKYTIPKAEDNPKYRQVKYVVDNLDKFEDVQYAELGYSEKEIQSMKESKLSQLKDFYDKNKYKVNVIVTEGGIVKSYKSVLQAEQILFYINRYIEQNLFPKNILLLNIPKILQIPSLEVALYIKEQMELVTTESYTSEYFNNYFLSKVAPLENISDIESIKNIKIARDEIPYIDLNLTAYSL